MDSVYRGWWVVKGGVGVGGGWEAEGELWRTNVPGFGKTCIVNTSDFAHSEVHNF